MGRIGPESKKVTKYHRMDTENDITTLIYDCRKACINCFNDIILYELIENEGDLADCDWCGSKDIKTIPIHMLSEMFRDSAKCYDEVTGPDAYMRGKNISECFQEDWDLFSSKIEGNPEFIQEMTLAILVADTRQKERFDLPDYSGFFNLEMPELEFEWFEKLEKIIKKEKSFDSTQYENHDNFPDRIEIAIEENAHTFNSEEPLYRARIHKSRKRKKRFSLSEMGAPPANKARAGRANKENEPVLYLATDEPTALAEVRAWRGMAVALAKVRIKQDLRILDLTDVHYTKSPFDSEYLCYDLQVIGLLQSFGLALSQPLLPEEEKTHYLPSQKLCELIKNQNIDGIIYPSAMGSGKNFVLFNPDHGEPYEIKYVRVESSAYPVQEINEYADLYDESPYEILIESADQRKSRMQDIP